jgi:hypothetical protein
MVIFKEYRSLRVLEIDGAPASVSGYLNIAVIFKTRTIPVPKSLN